MLKCVKERKQLEWPLMTTLELKDYVLYTAYATIQHCRGISNLTTRGAGGKGN